LGIDTVGIKADRPFAMVDQYGTSHFIGTRTARDAPPNVQAGTKERPHGTNKGTALIKKRAMT
jgi:hypothetical protein